MNSAVPWSAYWTMRRYLILLDVALLFDDPLRRAAWEVRIDIPFSDERPAGRSRAIRENVPVGQRRVRNATFGNAQTWVGLQAQPDA